MTVWCQQITTTITHQKWWKFCAKNKRKNEGKKQTETTQFQEDSMICKLLGSPILVFIFWVLVYSVIYNILEFTRNTTFDATQMNRHQMIRRNVIRQTGYKPSIYSKGTCLNLTTVLHLQLVTLCNTSAIRLNSVQHELTEHHSYTSIALFSGLPTIQFLQEGWEQVIHLVSDNKTTDTYVLHLEGNTLN